MKRKQALQNKEQLSQLSRKELVEIVRNQQQIITELQNKIEKLILSRDLDSKNSSKPPSSDLLKKPESSISVITPDVTVVEKPRPQHGRTRSYQDKISELSYKDC